MNDVDVVPEALVVGADRLHAVGTRRQNLDRLARAQVFDVLVRELLKHVLVAGALRGIAGAALLREHAERDTSLAQDLEQRAQRLLVIRLERSGASEPDEVLVPGRIERLEAGRGHELLALVVAESPDVA